MAFDVSKKQIREQYGLTIAFNYCEIERLLEPFTPVAYCRSRAYGWQCDFYANIMGHGVNIVTGYSTSGCGAVDLTEELHIKFKELDKKANSLNRDELINKIKELLNETRNTLTGKD